MAHNVRMKYSLIPTLTLLERAIASRQSPEAIPLKIWLLRTEYIGYLEPLKHRIHDGIPFSFDLYLGVQYSGKILYLHKWICTQEHSQELIDRIGEYIMAWYE